MAPWHRRKGEDTQLAHQLRGHVEAIWAIASTLTGDDEPAVDGGKADFRAEDESTAIEIVREVVRTTLLRQRRSRQRGLRLEVVIAATEAAAIRNFRPYARRTKGGAHAAPLDPRASALRRAFSRRLSWDVQARLWATEVEGIAESDVTRRLGPTHSREEAGGVTLRLAYLDLRKNLDEICRSTLRNAWGSSSDPENVAEDDHLRSCEVCQSEVQWLDDLRDALGSLPSTMPEAVWEEARLLVLEGGGGRLSDGPPGDPEPGVATRNQPFPSPVNLEGEDETVMPAADRPKLVLGNGSISNGHGHTHVCPAVEARKAEDHALHG